MTSSARRVSDLDEFELIGRLVRRLPGRRKDLVVGPGDDVAVMRASEGRLLLATSDAQVAGTHFLPERSDPHRLGRKSAAINVSDIASAGGLPTHFLVSLTLPPGTGIAFLEAWYDGLAAEAGRWGADVAGGNVSRGESLVLDLTLLGEVEEPLLVRRSGARPGDRLLLTGDLGAAAAGRRLLLRAGDAIDPEYRAAALERFETPRPRLTEARALASAGGVTAMIDVSDGLAADVGHVCDRSGVGVRLDSRLVPIADAARSVAAVEGADALAWALGGGEDYELLFTAPPGRVPALIAAVYEATGTSVREIGTIVESESGRLLVGPDGAETALEPRGWRHF